MSQVQACKELAETMVCRAARQVTHLSHSLIVTGLLTMETFDFFEQMRLVAEKKTVRTFEIHRIVCEPVARRFRFRGVEAGVSSDSRVSLSLE